MKKYIKVWKTANGSIPKDSFGRSYEIHHIDGNHDNNELSNLRLVTIQEHYDIHYSQGDWGACQKILFRMKKTPEEISKETSELQRRLVAERRHHLLSGEIQRKSNKSRIENGTHNLMTRPDGSSTVKDRVTDGTHHFLGSENNRRRIENGTHHFLGSENNRRRIENGTHHLLGPSQNKKMLESGTHVSQIVWTCEHCGKLGKNKTNYIRHHGENCKAKK